MKKWFVTGGLALLTAVAAVYLFIGNLGGQTSANKQTEVSPEKGQLLVEHYDMKLKLDTGKKILGGTVTLELNNQTEDTLSEICMRNFSASILEEGKKTKKGKDPSVSYVRLEQPLKPNSRTKLQIEYNTEIPKVDNRFGYHEEGKYKLFQLSFCFPHLAMYEHGKWNENPYFSAGESNFSRVTDYDIEIEAPKDYTIIASGKENTRQQGQKAITSISARKMRDMAIVASNYMKTEQVKTKAGVVVRHCYLNYKGMKEYNAFSLEAAKDAMDLYSERFGRYPYEELDVVQGFLPTGMEFPGLIMIGLPDVKNMRDIPKNGISYYRNYSDLCCLVAHEVAHQWFCVTVGNDPFQEPWLDEGLAEYCEDILYPQSGVPSIQKAMKADKKKDTDFTFLAEWEEDIFRKYMDGYIEQMTKGKKYYIDKNCLEYEDGTYSDYAYEGGKCFFYELQKELGDSTFSTMLREYYQKFYLQEATGEEFLQIVQWYAVSDRSKKIIDQYISGGTS